MQLTKAITFLLASASLSEAGPTSVDSTRVPSQVDALSTRAAYGTWLSKLIIAVKEYLRDDNAYDGDVPNKCVVLTSTTDGARCVTSISCSDKQFKLFDPWNVCYLGGQQFFSHPAVGDFSITYTKAGGKDGNTEDGLHHPVYRFKNYGEWEAIDVQAVIDGQGDSKSGNLCKKTWHYGGRTLQWECGIPMVNTAAFGISNLNDPAPAPGFTPGWCTAHVVQHQRNEYGVGADYMFDVVMYDAAGKIIGKIQRQAIDANSKTISMTSKLPFTLEIEAKGGDPDPVVFKYGGQTWKSGDGTHGITLGNGPRWGYENGNREGDMGWTC